MTKCLIILFHERFESSQCNATLATAGVIRGSPR